MNVSGLGEFGLIEMLQSYAPLSARVFQGIGDDAAVLQYTKNKHLLLATDMLVEDVHFTRHMLAASVGHKALACNISDIAAMGGVPTFAVVSIGLPKDLPVYWVKDVYQGLRAIAKGFGVAIVGGDTVQSQSIVINVALLGEVEKGSLTLRSGAKPGDWIFVTGPLGGALKSGRHLSFTPRVAQARFLVQNFKPHAMMDISDGLAGDLNHILKASGVGAQLDEAAIPRNKGVSLKQAFSDGEDFELLFTLAAPQARKLMDWQAEQKAFYFYPIGTITKDPEQTIHARSFTHFQ